MPNNRDESIEDDSEIKTKTTNIFIIHVKNIFLSPASRPGQAILGWAAIITFLTSLGSYLIWDASNNNKETDNPAFVIKTSITSNSEKLFILNIEENKFDNYSIWTCNNSLATPQYIDTKYENRFDIYVPSGPPSIKFLLNFSDKITAYAVFDTYANQMVGPPKYMEGMHSCDSFS